MPDVNLAANFYVQVNGFVPAQTTGVVANRLKGQVLDVAWDGSFAQQGELSSGNVADLVEVVSCSDLYIQRAGARVFDLQRRRGGIGLAPVVIVDAPFDAELVDALFGASPAQVEAGENTLPVLIKVFTASGAGGRIRLGGKVCNVTFS